jgi:hypothetical protein
MKRQLFVESLFRVAQDLVTLKIPWCDDIIILFVELIALLGFSSLRRLLWFRPLAVCDNSVLRVVLALLGLLGF